MQNVMNLKMHNLKVIHSEKRINKNIVKEYI